MAEARAGNAGERYDLVVRCAYPIECREVTSKAFRPLKARKLLPDEARKMMDGPLKPGSAIDVHVHPRSPRRCFCTTCPLGYGPYLMVLSVIWLTVTVWVRTCL